MRCPARLVGPGLAVALLAGCVDTGAPPSIAVEPPLGEDTCGLAPARTLIALDASAIAILQRSGPVRVIGPDQPVTMDYNPERLNVFTTAQGRIERVTCG
jgi:hypothetical protein